MTGRGRLVVRSEDKPSDLIIRQKCEAMIEYAHAALRQFPKSERHVLSAEIRRCCWTMLRLIVLCNKRYHKRTSLQELDAELDLLRTQIRLSKTLGFLDQRRYEHWSRINDEIGRLVGGWIKAMSLDEGRVER